MSDSATPWLGVIVGMPVLGVYFWANNQTLVQRVLSAKSIDEGRRGVLLTGFLTMTTLFIIAIPGVIARHLFPGLDKPDMVYPTMILQLMPVGLLGITMAALLSALISTLSAIMNSTSTLFTMDFYAKFSKSNDTKKLVTIGKITSCVVIIIAALWAPQIGRFGSLLKYYQEMLSYIAPPVVAVFIMGIFNKRANGQGAFIGLIGGLFIAILLLFFKNALFGQLHFLLIVPFLFLFCLVLTYTSSLFFAPSTNEKLTNTTFSARDFIAEYNMLKNNIWYKNYLLWAVVLLCLCALLWILFK
jgi:SSS family solute:Na+ symporter